MTMATKIYYNCRPPRELPYLSLLATHQPVTP
jgi:hypothetical protein